VTARPPGRVGLSLIVLLSGFSLLPAWDVEFPALRTPSSLRPAQIVLELPHRLHDLNGANIGLGLRGRVWSGLELGIDYNRFMLPVIDHARQEVRAGVSYAYHLRRILSAEAGVSFFQYDRPDIPEPRRNLLCQLALRSDQFAGFLTGAVNAAYDGYNKGFGLGLGLDAGLNLELGPVRRVSLFCAYYPVLNPDARVTGSADCYAVGLNAATYGHQFVFLLSNSGALDNRRLMLGSSDSRLSYGFVFRRMLDLKTM
jgi:hypothetical protein